MLGVAKWLFLLSIVSLVALQSFGQNQRGDQVAPGERRIYEGESDRQGRNLLDWIGLGTGPDTDPYQAKTNGACLNGDLAECFKSRALASFEEFFSKPTYDFNEHARIKRLPEVQLRQLSQEPYEFSQAPRSDETEWDQLLKFALRKVEKFVKSTGIEVDFPNEITEQGRYSPRFVDEIADEIDLIEDKKDTIFKRKQLKKLFIPLLIILKLFKLKLLLFLPLILGLASFKKFLGFLAIIIPGLIGFYKFCKPNLHSNFGHGNFYHHSGPQYSPAGIAFHQAHFKEEHSGSSYPSDYSDSSYFSGPHGGGGPVNFGDESHAQNLAYGGWNQYRNKESGIEAEPNSKTVVKQKKIDLARFLNK